MKENRTEQATPRRLQEAREKGDVLQSPDLIRAVLLIVTFLILSTVGAAHCREIFRFSRDLWSEGAWLETSPTDFSLLISRSIRNFLHPFFFFGGVALLLPIAIAIAVRGWLFLPKLIFPDPTRLQRRGGFSSFFSQETLYQFVSGLVKILLCVGGLLWFFRIQTDRLSGSVSQSPENLLESIKSLIPKVAIPLCVAFLLLSVLDLFYQRWSRARRLRMTPEEVRREAKEESGDAELKARHIEMTRSVGRERPKTEKRPR